MQPHPLISAESAVMASEGGDPGEGLSTEHLYFDDTELYSCTAHVTGQWETEMNGKTRTVLVLDRTVMHPQGGVAVSVPNSSAQ